MFNIQSIKQKAKDFFYPPRRFFRYLICGCGAAVINYSFFLLFCKVCKLHFSLAMFLAVLLTWIYSFCVNKLFVFESKSRKTFREGVFFVLQQLLLLGVANGLMWISISLIRIPSEISWLLVSGIILFLNFAGMKFIIWRNKNA